MTKPHKLLPGLLVVINTTMRGNVSYAKLAEKTQRDGQREERETVSERTIADLAEHERAKVVRSAATYTVGRVCQRTPFCYVCPEDKQPELEAAIDKARRMVAEFNATARVTQIGFYVITGDVRGSYSADGEPSRAAPVAALTVEPAEPVEPAPEASKSAPVASAMTDTEKALAALRARKREARKALEEEQF